MVFSTMIFLWCFMPIVFVLNGVIPKRFKNILLLLASLLFYAWGEPVYICLLLFVVVMNYIVGLAIKKYSNKKKQLIILIGAILCNIGILCIFKYLNFAVDTLNIFMPSWGIDIKQIALPLGISFYIFQALSYIIDVYRKDVEPQENFVKFALYISLFPQLVAGPIVRYKDICHELDERSSSLENFASGIRIFIYGLAKKVIFANGFARGADSIMSLNANEISSLYAWIGAFLYMLQIYYDFSGYSDMAIGMGKMLGFHFPKNFNYPYLSNSITEFWRRWHISLGTWFREYVYIPLGGNRKGKGRTLFNLGIVFLLTGIWHGASWNYVLWGVYYAAFIVIERAMSDALWIPKVPIAVKKVYTLLVVYFGWIIFRIESLLGIKNYVIQMFSRLNFAGFIESWQEVLGVYVLFLLPLGCIGCGFLLKWNKLQKWKNTWAELIACVVLLCYSILQISTNTYNPFIYFRF